ncbi:ABC transporter substrate-binding protein [Lactobacillus sp. S2-2]|uniref:MetQ/NlpA family ABC transporter substrate-binding protein n=1 Tax=Lactobacillus sp. S2-2 TaxID=2692917 RepID=UPI001F45089B|nr:MetQ/NlpA family ABC transporter substrate-binding protein [Lactobacillus sp. S2-2]MCF6515426.1 ABC transporter substrate-binding protein [Lactobacillus sp. S2-2]
MKKSIKILISIIVIVGIGGLTFVIHNHSVQQKNQEITIGTIGSDAKIWNYIAKLPETKKENLKLNVQSYTDGVSLNTATAQGKVDVNAFQSYAYFLAYNNQNKENKLSLLGTTYLEPLGIYSKKYQKINEIPDGSTIAIANNPANTARGLKLLEKVGLITLKHNFGNLSGTNDILKNPRHLKFKEIDDTTGPRVISDKTIAAALISNTIALEGHLNVLTDSIAHEQVDQSTKDNVNILATASSSKQKVKYKKLVSLYHNKKVQNYIKKEFDGTKIEVNKSSNYLRK